MFSLAIGLAQTANAARCKKILEQLNNQTPSDFENQIRNEQDDKNILTLSIERTIACKSGFLGISNWYGRSYLVAILNKTNGKVLYRWMFQISPGNAGRDIFKTAKYRLEGAEYTLNITYQAKVPDQDIFHYITDFPEEEFDRIVHFFKNQPKNGTFSLMAYTEKGASAQSNSSFGNEMIALYNAINTHKGELAEIKAPDATVEQL